MSVPHVTNVEESSGNHSLASQLQSNMAGVVHSIAPEVENVETIDSTVNEPPMLANFRTNIEQVTTPNTRRVNVHKMLHKLMVDKM